MIKGSCACGRIQYQTEGQPLAVNACHCSICQRVSGGPYIGFVDFAASEFQWTRQPDLWQAGDVAERGYCKACGSTMSMRYFLNADRVSVTLGTVIESQPPLPSLQAHIFLKDKAPYFVLADDGVKRYDEFPEDFSNKLAQWRSSKEKE